MSQLLSGVYFCKGFAQLEPLIEAMQVTTCFVTDGKVSHLNGVAVAEFSNYVVWSLSLKQEGLPYGPTCCRLRGLQA